MMRATGREACRAKRVVAALALSAHLGGCTFAVRHPPAAAAITGAVVGLSACELDGAGQGTCAIIGGGAAALLGLTAAIAMALAPEDTSGETVEPITAIPDADRPVHVPTKILPPPKPLQDLPPTPPTTTPATTPPTTTPPTTTPSSTSPATTSPTQTSPTQTSPTQAPPATSPSTPPAATSPPPPPATTTPPPPPPTTPR